MKDSGGLAISITLSNKGRKLIRLVKQWPKRTESVRRLIPYLAAKHVHHKILEALPNEEDWSAYRSSLEIVKVSGVGKGISAHALRAAPRTKKIKSNDVKRTVLYIQPNKRQRRVKPEIKILEKYSPWTVQTLPFLPRPSQAIVISRKLTKQGANRVAKARQKDQSEWRLALARCGRSGIRDKKLDAPSDVSAVPDIAFDAIRLEFGLRGIKSAPHWRPALRDLVSSGVRSLFRTDQRILQTFRDVKFKAWKRWPPRVAQTIGPSEAKNYIPFQKKLGFRAKL